MKVLVVDDEEFIRNGIANKIKRIIPYVEEVYKCGDAYEAIEMIHNINPSVIITDIRMPELDGLSFIEKVIQINPHIKFIIISGYQEFEYARKAIQLQVEGYLLKPVENEQLKELLDGIHNKLSSQVEAQSYLSQLKHQAKDGLQLMQNKYLMDLVYCTDKDNMKSIVAILESLEICFNLSYYSSIVIKINHIDSRLGLTSYENQDTIRFIIRNIIQEIVETKGSRAWVFEDLHLTDKMYAVINHGSFWSCHPEEQINCYRQIVSRLQELTGIDISIGSGRSYNDIKQIGDSYQEAHTAVIQLSSDKDGSVIHIDRVPRENKITFFLPDYEKVQLISYMRNNDYIAADKIIDTIFCTIEDHNLSKENIKILSLEIVMIITKFVIESDISMEKIFTENICSEEYLRQYTTLEQLKQAIKQCVKLICNYMIQMKKSDGETAIEEIKTYIDKYYYTEINLGQLANKYFINSSYLSQLFKNKTGKKFTDYITNVRIEKAKELLIATNLKTYEIAEVVGYSNPRYFSEVFVKYENHTPTQFRQKNLESKG